MAKKPSSDNQNNGMSYNQIGLAIFGVIISFLICAGAGAGVYFYYNLSKKQGAQIAPKTN